MEPLSVLYMTREYPPYVYGGAGVHVEHLAKEMARLARVQVKCFGDQQVPVSNPSVRGYPYEEGMFSRNPLKVKPALMTLLTCMHFNADPVEADVVHCHTWYAAWGGVLAKICYGIPLVVTVHSLEPLRPWKREQLGRGYDLSSWIERVALESADRIIAVSNNDRREIIARYQVNPDHVVVVPNGIDPEEYRPVTTTDHLARYGVDPRVPYVLFLGRVTRQKGIHHFLDASRFIDPQARIVLCAGSPDTPELASEIESRCAELERTRGGLVWIREMIPRPAAVELYSHASVFCCPSIYEPFGIINLEAMACETPVVGSAVGGIKDVVVDGETGFLVSFEPESPELPEPRDPDQFARDLAKGMNVLLHDGVLNRTMGQKGRERVVRRFGWGSVAARVLELYRELVREKEGESPV